MSSIAVVSDSHLAIDNVDAQHNWEAVVDHLDRLRPDLIVHAGDVSGGGHSSLADLAHARAQLDRLPAPVLVAPGNHDIGNADPDRTLTLERRFRYEQVVGPRTQTVDVDRWRIVGLDSQALASGHPDDEIEWARAAELVATDRPTVVVLHRPLGPTGLDEPDSPDRYLVEPHRSRLRGLLAEAGNVGVVISGHAHQWRSTEADGMVQIWAPSTWATVPDSLQPTVGAKIVGLVELDLAAPELARLVVPTGMVANETRTSRPRVAR